MAINNYKLEKADKFSFEEISFIKNTVLDAGEIDGDAFDGIIERNPILILYPDAHDVKAVGALKIPFDSYKRRIFDKSNLNLNPNEYKYELGWIVSLENGNGKSITKILANYYPKIYATIRDENIRMINIINSLGLKKVGISYKSERGEYYIGLYTKENND